MDTKAIMKAVNVATGRRFNESTIISAIDILEIEKPGLGDLQAIADWCETNRGASSGTGRNTKRKAERELAQRLLMENWEAFWPDGEVPTHLDGEESPDDLTPLGAAIAKTYLKTFQGDCATLQDEDKDGKPVGPIYLAIGSRPQKGQSRTKNYARLNKEGEPIKATSKKTAMKIADLNDETFGRLLPRRQAWKTLVEEATNQ
jgi:hypothetical protein